MAKSSGIDGGSEVGSMQEWPYTKGLHELGNGCYAYLQPDGTWGYSNSGLITADGETLLVDTLMELKLTTEMLRTMRTAVPSAASIQTLVNTHSNPDHTNGNQLVQSARIISSTACRDEMREQAARPRPRLSEEAGAFFQEVLGSRFDLSNICVTFPSETFDGELHLTVGTKEVRLLELGPAHTRGDIVVYLPAERIVFTGDILFHGGHPVIWAGPVSNWIKACDRILGWDVEVVVPGHGSITGKRGVRELKHYLEFVRDESHKRREAGMDYEAAARDISLDAFTGWTDPERIVANVYACYSEFGGGQNRLPMQALFASMARYHFETKRNSTGVRT
jgi:glyoxylase-like metal-dependent hydrolase (beta-lactamase superfamily II)